ncbi:branched-chain amino acid ABC transporter substrate-binding protein [Sporolactobacillus sp. KGMB 08714]|uniref:branched-chain amino acid ABC transporter substrate-binding protein n=1 Tax=Sporolactobacillus sp. KGMB 08714 TaxID=3064704 RepID=UPI002FBD974B
MKRVTDERLKIELLKNIRIVFIFQTLGILAVLIYTGISRGADAAFQSPLFLVFTGTGVIISFLQMRVSADMDEMSKHRRRKPMPYYGLFLIALAVGLGVGLLNFVVDPLHKQFAWITGGVFFICFLTVYSVGYFNRKKRGEQDRDE